MQITNVTVRKTTSDKMVGVASVVFDNMFVVHDIKIINGEKGLFIAMPSRKKPDGEFVDIAHPINGDCRTMISDAVLDAYNKAE